MQKVKCKSEHAANEYEWINIAAARAVDREFEYKCSLKFGVREAGGLRPPPHPPAFREAEAIRALGCKGWSLFRDRATCPGQLRCQGQNLFSTFRLFLNKPLVRGSFAAWGRTFS